MLSPNSQTNSDDGGTTLAVEDRLPARHSVRADKLAAWRAEIDDFAAAIEIEAKQILKLLTAQSATTRIPTPTAPSPEEIPATHSVSSRESESQHPPNHSSLSPTQDAPETDRLSALKARLQKQLAGSGQVTETNTADQVAVADLEEIDR